MNPYESPAAVEDVESRLDTTDIVLLILCLLAIIGGIAGTAGACLMIATNGESGLLVTCGGAATYFVSLSLGMAILRWGLPCSS